MSQTELTELTDLDGLIYSYYQNKTSMENYKETVDFQNNNIKSLMQKAEINEYTTIDGFTAKLTVQKRESFIEPALIKKLKELGITSPIKMVETVDMDELENVIYNHQLDAAELTDCKQVKEVLTLKVKEAK